MPQRPLGVPQVMCWVVVSLAMSMVTVLQVIRMPVRCRVNGGVPGDGVGSAADEEGIVGDAWVPVRGWWGGEGDSAVGPDGGLSGISGVGEAGDAVHSLYRAGTRTPDGGC